jgi:hypothetical protein
MFYLNLPVQFNEIGLIKNAPKKRHMLECQIKGGLKSGVICGSSRIYFSANSNLPAPYTAQQSYHPISNKVLHCEGLVH